MRSLDTFLRTMRMTDRLIRGIRVSYLKFLGDDSGCSVENGFGKRQNCLQRARVRLLWQEPETTAVEVGRRRVVGLKGCKYRICN